MTPMPISVTARSPHFAASRYGTTPTSASCACPTVSWIAPISGANCASRRDLPAFDRPRLLQRPLRRHHPGAHQRRVDLRIGVGLASVLDLDHRGQDGPQAGVVVQVEWLVDAEAARLGDTTGIRLGVVPYLDAAKWGLLAVTLIGIGVMLWARIDDRRMGLR